MHASQTQLDAYHDISPKHKSETQQRIIDAFAGDSRVLMTRDELAAATKLPVPTICGRVNELVKADLLAVRGSDKRPGKRARQQLIGLPVSATN